MKVFSLALFFVVGACTDDLVIERVYGEVPAVAGVMPRREKQSRSREFWDLRTPENCVFPIDVVVVQDVTSSFLDDIQQMRDVQISVMYNVLTKSHPGSRFGVFSFRDKPLSPVGNEGDYCFREECPLASALENIETAYAGLKASGGGDPPENQFGAVIAALQSPTVGWGDAGSLATKLVVISTDAAPHFRGDEVTPIEFDPFSGSIDFADPAGQCLKVGYPTPAQVLKEISVKEAYAAFLVFDGDYQNGLVGRSWRYFNRYIGQAAEFINPLANDSSNFWEQLAKAIQALEATECTPPTTPPTPPPTTLPVLSTVFSTGSTGVQRVSTETTLPTSVSVCPEPRCVKFSGVRIDYRGGDLDFMKLDVNGRVYEDGAGLPCVCP